MKDYLSGPEHAALLKERERHVLEGALADTRDDDETDARIFRANALGSPSKVTETRDWRGMLP